MVTKMSSRQEMLKKLREKMSEKKSGFRDPDQFIPPKAKDKEKLEYFFRVLPPLQAGENFKGGVCEADQDLWFYENGNHWVNNERHECPRVHDREDCALCELGFTLMKDNDDDKYKAEVRKKYMPRSGFAINIYFVNSDKNPENLRGKVMWMSVPKTIYDIMNECIENDDPGTSEDPKPCGIFYHPTEGGYVFKLMAEKQGQWNTYERSGFLVNSFGPLAKDAEGKPDVDRIQKILDQRHLLPAKFHARDSLKIDTITKKLLAKQTGGDVEEKPDQSIDVSGVVKGGANKISKPAHSKPTTPAAPAAPAAPAPAAPAAPAAEEVIEESAEAPVSRAEDVVEEKPAAKPTTKPAAAAAPAAKPTASPSKPAAVAKPTKPAQAPATPASADEDNDPDLKDILDKINAE